MGAGETRDRWHAAQQRYVQAPSKRIRTTAGWCYILAVLAFLGGFVFPLGAIAWLAAVVWFASGAILKALADIRNELRLQAADPSSTNCASAGDDEAAFVEPRASSGGDLRDSAEAGDAHNGDVPASALRPERAVRRCARPSNNTILLAVVDAVGVADQVLQICDVSVQFVCHVGEGRKVLLLAPIADCHAERHPLL